ncbi:axotactin isoform X2 [Bacillus rossius redtenbacheri]|uniref:axotactin isoform X2 n=1 Tax=Bacillus rossius redtenbacheri TaxID=93214 RepID=UPI002FDE25E7
MMLACLALAAGLLVPTAALPSDNLWKQFPERCTLPPETGDCRSFVHKWFFDPATRTCNTFVWGGCPVNDNRFDTEPDCYSVCSPGNYTRPWYVDRWEETRTAAPKRTKAPPKIPTLPPRIPSPAPTAVPVARRGAELTFQETGHQRVFMFAQAGAFVQIDGQRAPAFQLRVCREISFQFRTRLPHGLLVYHAVKGQPEGIGPYALYIIVENGQLKVVHVFNKHSTSVTVGKGLNRDVWHNVTVRIDVKETRLVASVDGQQADTQLLGLDPSTNYGVTTDLMSVVLVGGLSSEEQLHGVKYIIESFVGCIRSVVLRAGPTVAALAPVKPLVATKHENVVEGCLDKCRTFENLCFVGSHCVNHYSSYSCDCFGREYEGEQCDIYSATVLTFRGSTYVSYRVYDWRDRVHSSINRISLFFKTRFDDSVLFYASGEPYGRHYAAASIRNESVFVELDLGDGPVSVTIGRSVSDNHWHNLTVLQQHGNVTVVLDKEWETVELPGPGQHLYLDPEVYFGGGRDMHSKRGLVSSNNFAGCMKYVFFNDVSVLYELKRGGPQVLYHGVLQPEFYDADVEVIPVTFAFPSSYIWWPSRSRSNFSLRFDFKTNRSTAVLMSSNVTTSFGSGYWEVRVAAGEIRFELVPNSTNNVTHVTAVKFNSRAGWHSVELSYLDGEVRLTVDLRHSASQMFGLEFEVGDRIFVGTGTHLTTGLVGCMREIYINGQFLEPRSLVRLNHTVGVVSLDDCQLVDPCVRPNACEHGGKCSVRDERVVCDCTGTGYIGNNCHFAKFRKTCEELAQLGYTKPDVYLIDIDGNGRFPPAHVKCEFQSQEDVTKTIVEHNLPSQVDVRSLAEQDFSFSIKYREFSAEMLQELIQHSLRCSQYVKYDCYKAPLDLHSATWFLSSAQKNIVDYVGSSRRGACPCAVNHTCVSPKLSCNCDMPEGKWLSDEGFFTSGDSLGITDMVFLQQKDLGEDALGRITLGPLECVETNTQRYVVTFTSSQSYIEVPGWRKGEISFTFRTTGEQAILLYQPPIRPNYPSFMVALTSDYQLTFNFTLNTGRSQELAIKSNRRLNDGEWQKIWMDYNEHHVRFMINTLDQMVDLLPEEEFGPFEGSMFIGGAPESLLKNSTVRQGLIGCFRGLVVNGEILDIYSYMSVHLSEIIKDCQASCDPNPCRNGARCKELWSRSECVCENRWAHQGTFCEMNINEKALTFLNPESFFKKNYVGELSTEDRDLLSQLFTSTLLVNLRTYDQQSLVLYINDHLNNFLQLHVEQGRFVVFTFNSGPTIYNVSVEYPGLNNGNSVQVAVERSGAGTMLHVNERNASLAVKIDLLANYTNRPWANPEKEILSPQRPPAPPTEYLQINLGGYDPLTLNALNGVSLPGYVGCIRGLKIGNHLLDLPAMVNKGLGGVLSGCRMKCDDQPCKNQGICIEDFQKSEASCNCEITSYSGEFCDDEKGADFGGQSVLQQTFTLLMPVNQVKIQLAFSSTDTHQWNSVLLLLQAENTQGYYLLVTLVNAGELVIAESREGTVTGARINNKSFLDGARHSVYYQRTGSKTMLLIDREEVPLKALVTSLTDEAGDVKGVNEVQIGGLNTSDPRFSAYKSYKGCLSNVLVEVNRKVMKPLEEYMHFTRPGSNDVQVKNAAGIRSAQCAFFDLHKQQPVMYSNVSMEVDKEWAEDPPAKIPYKSQYSSASKEKDNTFNVVFVVMVGVFVVVIVSALCEVWRSHRRWRRRKEEERASVTWQPKPVYQEPPAKVKPKSYKSLPQQDQRPAKPARVQINSADVKPPPDQPPPPPPTQNANTKKALTSEQELQWDPLSEKTELLAQSVEDIPAALQNGVSKDVGPGPKSVVHRKPTLPYSIDELGSIEFTTMPYA